LRPAKIIERFALKNPIYEATAAYGHFGRTPYSQKTTVTEDGKQVEKEIEFFTWEKLDSVNKIKEAFFKA
jgi:S-adenosylmethionine synthetase